MALQSPDQDADGNAELNTSSLVATKTTMLKSTSILVDVID
jgi:hypothetical protein